MPVNMKVVKVKKSGVSPEMRSRMGTKKYVEAVESGKEPQGMNYKDAQEWKNAERSGALKQDAAEWRKKLNKSDSTKKADEAAKLKIKKK